VLWIWQLYGGWRGLYHLAIEPWVGHPVRLEQAIEAGRQPILAPGHVEYEAAMIVYIGLTSVTRMQRNGMNYKVYA
jgi:hypothetical protein